MGRSIIFTKHAEDLLVERNFSKEVIKESVLDPDEKREGEENTWYAIKKKEGKYLRVVVSGKEKPYTVVTAYSTGIQGEFLRFQERVPGNMIDD